MCYEKISPHSSHTISSQIPSLVYNSDGTSLINSQLHCAHCFFKSPHNRPVFVAFKTTSAMRRAQMPFVGPKIEVLWSPPGIMNLQLGAQKINPTPSHVVPLAAQPNQKVQKIRIFEPENPKTFVTNFNPQSFLGTVQLFALFFPS